MSGKLGWGESFAARMQSLGIVVDIVDPPYPSSRNAWEHASPAVFTTRWRRWSILIRRSKTDQAGEGRLGYLSAGATEIVRRWLDAAAIRSGPLFSAVRGRSVVQRGLHPYAVSRTVKQLARKAGANAATTRRLSGHSMRAGAALDMVEKGIDLVPIMHAGGWKSPAMVLRYTQQIDLAKSGMARLHAMRTTRGLRFAGR